MVVEGSINVEGGLLAGAEAELATPRRNIWTRRCLFRRRVRPWFCRRRPADRFWPRQEASPESRFSAVCGKIGFLSNVLRRIRIKVSSTDWSANMNHWRHPFHPNLFWRSSNKMMHHLVAGCVMEGSLVFYQKTILEHSISFHEDFVKRCLLTHRVSQIL